MKEKFKIKRWSLRLRIFLSLILITLIASFLVALVSVYQFKKEAKEYHEDRLERKENSIKEHISYILATTTYPLNTENLPLIFRERIHELANIQGTEINLYDLNGHLLKSSKAAFSIDTVNQNIPPNILRIIRSTAEKRFVNVSTQADGKKFRASYSYIKDTKFKPLGILNLPHMEDDGYYDKELNNFLIRFGQVYSFMLLISVVIAYFLSSYITKSIKEITDRIKETRLNEVNEKIDLGDSPQEISLLVDAYNNLVDDLDESAALLAQKEREEAWREMAKQVAHEIKNPLTPMRLTVQSFERKFDPADPNIKAKLKEYSATLIQQIDTMTSVASAFSSFASMPAQQNETLNVVKIVQLALEIFNEPYITFQTEETRIVTRMDRTQLIRIITNLVKNATQAMDEYQPHPRVVVHVFRQGDRAKITVKDNGKGISVEDKSRIFEPKFTTKSSGMGLGLGIIKNIVENYHGTISFESTPGVGTMFTVSLPITIIDLPEHNEEPNN
ncbi:histidine kinase [Flavobacterium akiainvivens]|uniref:histidine kinase n=1 Tax=Flavobacterium akiainvivens TaxID=1202724 RepID=A0A0M9VIY7_9FLAO|nr:ATP-binding protein [Flavobacterium akiainvivens]KOS07170.1 histidine kinase [Flavobacterium akiainvivens]SFQ72996.1 His Kinase A (phospho-acceptor) domain-containing protein [Flavobacterium akiainvivens]